MCNVTYHTSFHVVCLFVMMVYQTETCYRSFHIHFGSSSMCAFKRQLFTAQLHSHRLQTVRASHTAMVAKRPAKTFMEASHAAKKARIDGSSHGRYAITFGEVAILHVGSAWVDQNVRFGVTHVAS